MTPTETETKTNGYANFETWLTAHYLGNVHTYYFRIRDRFETLAKTKTDRDEISFRSVVVSRLYAPKRATKRPAKLHYPS